MKRSVFSFFLLTLLITVQANTIGKYNNRPVISSGYSTQEQQVTATLKNSSRLFKVKEDLTSVIVVIPSGSIVTVLGSDSTYYKVKFEESEGFIFKRHAVINEAPAPVTMKTQQQNGQNGELTPEQKQVKRFDYLEYKYGTNLANKLIAGKIWKGMSAEMVKDSWGPPAKINRVVADIVTEEWIYSKSWLFIENNILVDWGAVKK